MKKNNRNPIVTGEMQELKWFIDHYISNTAEWDESDEALAACCGVDVTAYVENRMLGIADTLADGDTELAYKIAKRAYYGE